MLVEGWMRDIEFLPRTIDVRLTAWRLSSRERAQRADGLFQPQVSRLLKCQRNQQPLHRRLLLGGNLTA